MTLSNPRIIEINRSINGWLDDDEAIFLYNLAQSIPDGGTIVELGSYQGRSTVILAHGVQERGGKVIAIDHYSGKAGDVVITADDLEQLRNNVQRFGLSNVVESIVGDYTAEADNFQGEIDLLFLDGNHDYKSVKADLAAWSSMVAGKIVMHDTKPDGEWQGVVKALDEFVAGGDWAVSQRVDSTSVLERVAVAQDKPVKASKKAAK